MATQYKVMQLIPDDRPWLELYGPGIPHEIEPEHDSMLAAFRASVERAPERTALQSEGAAAPHEQHDARHRRPRRMNEHERLRHTDYPRRCAGISPTDDLSERHYSGRHWGF